MRAAIFIDGGYLQNQLRHHRVQADFTEMANYFLYPLRQIYPMDLLRCYYYYCPPWVSEVPTEDEQRRLETYEIFQQEIAALDRWALRHGKLQKRWDRQKEIFEQKRVDVLLSVDMVGHAAAGHIQHAILVAGDSDFIPAVQSAKESGVTVSLWCGPNNTVHDDLIKKCDTVFELDWTQFPQTDKSTKKTSDPKAQNGNPVRQRSTAVRRNTGHFPRKPQTKSSYRGRKQQPSQSQEIQSPCLPDNGTKMSWKDRIKKITGI